MECDFQEAVEQIKSELETLKHYSIKKMFNKVDRRGRGYIDVTAMREFLLQGMPEEQVVQLTTTRKKTFKR